MGIVDWGLLIGDCKMAPWSVVSLEWSWVYGSTWVLLCQIRCGVDSRLRGNDGGGCGSDVDGCGNDVGEGAGMAWEGAGMTWEGVGMTWARVRE